MLILANARIFDGLAALPGLHTVTLDGNRIVAVGDRPATGAECVIDLAGMTLMPGLITGHFHPDFYTFTLTEGLAGEPLGKERPPGVLMAIAIRNCGVLLESGFTGYIGASCGHDIDASLKMAIAEGIMPGPRIRACSHHIGTIGDLNHSRKWWRRFDSPGTDVFGSGPEELRRMVREATHRGAETIKIFASSGRGIGNKTERNMGSDEIAAIVDAAHGRGAKVRAHVAGKDMVLECIDHGVDIIDHGDGIDDEVIAAMVDAGTYWVPSLIYVKCMLELGWADAAAQRFYQESRAFLPRAQAAGVKILIGDDYSGVFRDIIADDPLDHQVGRYAGELAYYAAIDGIVPADVLAWGTANPGTLLAAEGETVGRIVEGAVADLVVIDGDPLADLSILGRPQDTLKAVIRDGALVIDRLPSPDAAKSRKLAA